MPKRASDSPKKPYRLILALGARRAFVETLPAAVVFAAWELISGPLVADPHLVGAALRAPFEGHRSARRGQYRVRYRIDEERHEIQILDIENWWDLYRA